MKNDMKKLSSIIRFIGLQGFNKTFLYFKNERKQCSEIVDEELILNDIIFHTKLIFTEFETLKDKIVIFKNKKIAIIEVF